MTSSGDSRGNEWKYRLEALLFKEFKLISKRRSFLFLLLFIPLFFGIVFSTYKDAVPRDTPVGIVITQENVTPAQVRAIVAIARTFSAPHVENNLNEALERLQREEYYVVIEVREYRGLLSGEFVVYYDDSMAPVSSVSRDLLELLRLRLSGADIKEVPVNKHASFPQFLFPGTLVIFSILIGLELIPSTLLEEREHSQGSSCTLRCPLIWL